MPKKYALVIGNTEYTDSGLAKLNAPGRDAEDFARALQLAEMAAFDEVVTLVNENVPKLNEAIEDFFADKKPDDLLVFYFSGHGVRDDEGSLFLAVKSTRKARLHSTAITAEFIRKLMDKSRSTRQVIILDCCNSGAFPQGQTKGDTAMGMAGSLQGYGRVVLTATDKLQYAWEGDTLIETNKSLFTHFLVKGMEGAADRDDDGKITVDELYDYAFDKVREVTPNQTPTKSATGQKGEIILREGIKKEVKPTALPADLLSAAENTMPYVREAAVKQLENLLNGKNAGLALSAGKELQSIIADENTTYRVAQLAKQALENAGQALTSAAEEEEEKRLAAQKQEQEREAKKKQAAAELRAAREKEELKRRNAEIYNRSREAAARTTRTLLSKLKIPALILAIGFVGYFLWQGISSPIPVAPDVTNTPTATNTVVSPTKTKTPTPTTLPTSITLPTQAPTLEPAPGTTMTGEHGEILVYVPKGEFTMGNGDSDAPVHTVYLDAYYIDQFEVTNKQYQACVDAGTCKPPSSKSSYTHLSYYENPEFDNYPVLYVNWDKANGYCEVWAGGDLPTEAQWEKAATWDETNQTQRAYPWGDSIDCTYANYFGKNYGSSVCVGDTTPVGSYDNGKSPYGAYDMAGNVWEWVNDYYQSDYYADNASNPQGPTSSDYRELRGGSWYNFSSNARSASRNRSNPTDSNRIIGFRCARSLP